MGMAKISFGTLTMMHRFVFHMIWRFTRIPHYIIFIRVTTTHNVVFVIEMICDV